jgi:uncharacterized protein YjdB
VDEEGLVHGLAEGSTLVRVTSEGVGDSARVRVRPDPVVSVVLKPDSLVLTVGDTVQLAAVALNAEGQVLERVVYWEGDDTTILSVDHAGAVVALREGVALVTATAGGITASAVATVRMPNLAALDVRPASLVLEVGDTATLTALARDAEGRVVERAVTWESTDPSVLSVDTHGVVQGLGEGTARVTATIDQLSATAMVTVSRRSAVHLTVEPDSLALEVGDVATLVARARDGADQVLDRAPIWSSSSPTVASVTSTGRVVAHHPGQAEVRALLDGMVATASVKVTEGSPSLASITVEPTTLLLVSGEVVELTATVWDDAGNVMDSPVTWTSDDPAVATVTSDGEVEARGSGSALITAAAGSITTPVSVKVTPLPAPSIEVRPDLGELTPGETLQFAAHLSGFPAGVTEDDVLWITSDLRVATASTDGRVQAVAPGVTEVVASLIGAADTTVVTVVEPPVPMPLGIPGDWELAFSDEFNGSELNTAHWTPHLEWCPVPINGQLQAYDPTPGGAVSIRDGALLLTATATPRSGFPFTSGAISSHNKLTAHYGVVEARLRVPAGAGLWPAFWLMPGDLGWPPEIDIAEFDGAHPSRVYLAAHWGTDEALRYYGKEFDGPDFTAEYHIYSIHWTPEAVVWYVDGVQQAEWKHEAVPSAPMYLILNLAVGGTFVGDPDPAALPATLAVDYVRIWETPHD